MMPLLNYVTDDSDTKWRIIPRGVWRWELLKPEVRYYDQWDAWKARFPLNLVPSELERLYEEHGKPPEDEMQSTRVTYMTGLSLGRRNRSTALLDFLTAVVGQANSKRFYEWIVNDHGGPPRGPDDPDAELERIRSWLEWFEGLEVYGSIRHEEDKNQKGVWWARFGGPMAVGSLPGQKEDEYQAVARGKVRSMIAEFEASLTEEPPAQPAKQAPVVATAPTSKKRSYAEAFPEDKDDAPF